MLIGWRAAQCHLAKNEMWAKKVYLAQWTLLKCSYHVQTHRPAEVDPQG